MTYIERNFFFFNRPYFCFWLFPHEPRGGSFSTSFLSLISRTFFRFLVFWLVSQGFILAILLCGFLRLDSAVSGDRRMERGKIQQGSNFWAHSSSGLREAFLCQYFRCLHSLPSLPHQNSSDRSGNCLGEGPGKRKEGGGDSSHSLCPTGIPPPIGWT